MSPILKIVLFVIVFVGLFFSIHHGTTWFLNQSSPPIWLLPTSLLGMALGYGDEHFVYVGDLITTSIVFGVLLIMLGFVRKRTARR